MIKGEFEPNSIVTFFNPAALHICSPTSLLPVNVTFLTLGSETIRFPISPPGPVIHCIASSGAPASSNIFVNLRAESGVSVAGLIITEFPAAMLDQLYDKQGLAEN